jgi:thiamine biosynthesis lipoprotein
MVLRPERFVHVEHVMGTAVTIDVRGRRPAPGAIEDAVAWLHDVDATYSTYRRASAVSRYDRGELPDAEASADLRSIITRCETLRRETRGYFDARAAGAFDPSALVKGWAVQRAADGLRAAGVRDLCLTAGGDVATRGAAAPGVPWRVGVQHPRDPQAIAAVVEARDGLAVATSGTYERGEHIVDPIRRRPPRGVLSVTVAGPDLGSADAYATAAFAMGPDGPEWTLGLDDYESMTILDDDTVLQTPGFPAVSA